MKSAWIKSFLEVARCTTRVSLLCALGVFTLLLAFACCQSQPDQQVKASGERAPDPSEPSHDSSSNKPGGTVTSYDSSDTLPNDDITVIAFKSDRDWGYAILVDDEPFIRQPHVPVIPGHQGFDSEETALLVGRYVAEQLKKGIYPPHVTLEELESLGVAVRDF